MKEYFGEIKYVVGVLLGAFISFAGLTKWKARIDFRVEENEKDIRNLKTADKSFVLRRDFDKIEKSLSEINKQLFEIAKNMPMRK